LIIDAVWELVSPSCARIVAKTGDKGCGRGIVPLAANDAVKMTARAAASWDNMRKKMV